MTRYYTDILVSAVFRWIQVIAAHIITFMSQFICRGGEVFLVMADERRILAEASPLPPFVIPLRDTRLCCRSYLKSCQIKVINCWESWTAEKFVESRIYEEPLRTPSVCSNTDTLQQADCRMEIHHTWHRCVRPARSQKHRVMFNHFPGSQTAVFFNKLCWIQFFIWQQLSQENAPSA